jgi:hypothetical protein
MGDHRASVKIKFSIYGETYKMDSWINWSVGGEVPEIDDRVIEFFRGSYLKARGKMDDEIAEEEGRKTEEAERAELARLKAKYEQG